MGSTQQTGKGCLANAFQLVQSERRGRDFVLVPEAVGLLQLLELQGQQTANSGSKEGSNHGLFKQGTNQQINILSVSKRENYKYKNLISPQHKKINHI